MTSFEESRIQAILYNVLSNIQKAVDLSSDKSIEIIHKLNLAYVEVQEVKNMLSSKEW